MSPASKTNGMLPTLPRAAYGCKGSSLSQLAFFKHLVFGGHIADKEPTSERLPVQHFKAAALVDGMEVPHRKSCCRRRCAGEIMRQGEIEVKSGSGRSI